MMKDKSRKTWRILLITGFALLAVTGALFMLAKTCPGFFNFYTPFSRKILYVMGQITGVFKFSVYELLVAILVILFFWTGYKAIRHHRIGTWVTLIFSCFSAGIFLFTTLWGLNHFGPEADEKLGISTREYSVEELKAATKYYMEKAGKVASLLEENDDGTTVFPSFDELAEDVHLGFDFIAGAACSNAGGQTESIQNEGDPHPEYTEEFEILGCSGGRVKKLAASRLYAYSGLTGIFIAFTGEANVSSYTYPAALPFTMCHETAHRLSFAPEEEANFVAFLACEANEKPEFQYSGYYMACMYCGNALYKADPEAYKEVRSEMPARLQADFKATNAHYAQFDGKAKEVAEKVNDSYLKVYGEEAGVQSYGMVTDFLIEWYMRYRQ